MKPLRLLLTLVLFVTALSCPVYAETATVSDEVVGNTTEITIEEERLRASEALAGITTETKITIVAASRKHSVSFSLVLNDKNLSSAQNAMESFLENIFDITTICEEVPPRAQSPGIYDHYASITISSEERSRRFRFTLEDDRADFMMYGYRIENPGDIVDYIASCATGLLAPFNNNIPDKGRTIFSGLDFDKETYSLGNGRTENFSYMEKLEFDLELDDSYADTAFDEIASDGKVNCTIEQITTGSIKYILTIEGNRGKKQFITEERSSLGGFSGSSSGNALGFWLNYLLEGDTAVLYDARMAKYRDSIEFKGDKADGRISSVTMSYSFGNDSLKPPSKILASNIKYEFYGSEEVFNQGRNLLTRFGIKEKDIEIKNDKTIDVQEQDPENYATEMRAVYDYPDGKEVVDFYIDFVAKTNLNITTSAVPDWFKALGNDVELSMVSIVDTINGKPHRKSYPLLRFKGSKGTQWFEVNIVEAAPAPGEFTANVKDDYTAYLEFNSLLSFDGFTRRKNTVSYDTFSMYMKFEDKEKTKLSGIEFTMGRKYTIDTNEINYTGGGKGVYENWW